jgi:hypothetical protein
VTSEGFQLLNFVLNQSQLEKVGDIYRDELVNFVEVEIESSESFPPFLDIQGLEVFDVILFGIQGDEIWKSCN